VRGAWLALGGPATIEEEIDFGAVEDFFRLLEEHASGGDVDDWQAVRDELALRFVTSPEEAITPVKIMTLFRAKGLEFDTVILPGLARTPPADDRELLRWRTRPGGGLLLASLANRRNASAVYGYLSWLAATEADHELGRLLYVGVTRARRRLHLVATAQPQVDEATGEASWRTPRSASALGKLWKVLGTDVAPPMLAANEAIAAEVPEGPPLVRLSDAFAMPALPVSVPARTRRAAVAPSPDFEWARADAAIVGTVAHRYLATRAAHAGLMGDEASRAALAPKISAELAAEGIARSALDDATATVLATLAAVEGNERGRWLFDPRHQDARSEWALAGLDTGQVVHVTLDRTFVADGVRWIVDFKTGRHEGGGVEAFLAREVDRYRGQLERYARVVRALDARPIKLALYYPLVEGGWREWAFDPPGTQQSLF
jgi:ATP-dependent exoDNAse (exonuclease V) beta subunit